MKDEGLCVSPWGKSLKRKRRESLGKPEAQAKEFRIGHRFFSRHGSFRMT